MDDLLLRRVRPGLGGELADVRVNDGRVTAITEPGSAGFAARVVDGHGGTLLPGLVDAHVHLVQWATSRRRIPLEAARSAGEAIELLLAHLLATPAPQSELVVGGGGGRAAAGAPAGDAGAAVGAGGGRGFPRRALAGQAAQGPAAAGAAGA